MTGLPRGPDFRRPVRRKGIVVAGLLILIFALVGVPLFRATLDADVSVATRAAERRPFVSELVEAGELDALRSITYASQIKSNQAKIVALAPEGKFVEIGDLLVRFDAAPFHEEIRRSESELAQAHAAWATVTEDLKLQKLQNAQEIAAAESDVHAKNLELADAQEGQGKLRLDESDLALADAKRELNQARRTLEDLRPLLAEGFITRLELERAKENAARSEEALALAHRRRDVLLGYSRPLELSRAETDARTTRETAVQTRSASAFRLAQRAASIEAAQSRIAEAQGRLDDALGQLRITEIRADVGGIVVYRDIFVGSERRKPQIGDQVWANQPLIVLPDLSKMVVHTRVREADVHKVGPEQSVTLRIDAYPDLRLRGRVTLIGTLAQSDRERRGGKFFGVTIEIEETEPRLRPGMTARARIEVERRESALQIPVAAVFEEDQEFFVYRAVPAGFDVRPVVLGPSNDDSVVIESGLDEGDEVALHAPGVAA